MASPKFDSMSVDLSKKIGDYVATAATNGIKLTAAERNAILNRALKELHNMKWNEVQGDKDLFIQVFPELFREAEISTDANGLYAVGDAADLTYDFYRIFDGRIIDGNVYITAPNKSLYQIVKSSAHSDFIPSSTKPYVFELSGTLEFLPAASFNTEDVKISYIRFPVDPSNGNPFSAAGTYDSPFYSTWNEAIVEIAKQIYLDMAQER